MKPSLSEFSLTPRLTNLEAVILKAIQVTPHWLNCSGNYLAEALALQAKGLIDSRVVGNKLQIKRKVTL